MSDVLVKLKSLRYQRSEASLFTNHVEFLAWGDSVTPLLSFDSALQANFKSCLRSANTTHIMGSSKDSIGSINRAIGIVNQAIISLEIMSVPNPTNDPSDGKKQTHAENQHPMNLWQRPVGLIWVTVVGGTLVLMIGYLFRHYLGISL